MDLKKPLALLYLILLAIVCIYTIRYYPSITSKIPKADIDPEKINPGQPVNIVSIKIENTATVIIYRSFIKPTYRHAIITIKNQIKQETLLTPGQVTTLTYNTLQKPIITIKH